MEGRIIKNISNDYVVSVNDTLYNCKARGKFRKDNITPLVGDIVEIDADNSYIIDIKKRNKIIKFLNNDIQTIITTKDVVDISEVHQIKIH